MNAMDDSALLREYATERSETAFASLVQRHIHFVYSSALRQVRNAQLAEEVTQAVFIILARKAGGIRPGTVLAGWFFNTARFVAAAELRAAARRHKHEQEAGMDSSLRETTTDASWEQIAPFLDEGLAQLSEKDRQAVLLRFFEEKSFQEVGAKLGANEDAARMRVARALKSLRGFFLKRGLTLSVTALATVLSANAVQAAPASLVAAVAATTALQGAAATASTATLIQGALKLMAWAKLKTTVAVGLGILLAAGTTAVTVQKVLEQNPPRQTQKLADGSWLTLEGVKIGWTNEFLQGSAGKKITFPHRLATGLSAEFRLSGATPISPLVDPTFTFAWPFRTVVAGEDGLEYMDVLEHFEKYENDYYGWLNTGLFPRGSRRLRIRIEQHDALGAPWRTVAEFTAIQQPGQEEAWQPEPAPVTRSVEGMQIHLGEVTVQRGPFDAHNDVNDRNVVIPWQMMRDGVPLTNWTLQDLILRDSTGNAAFFGAHNSMSNGWMLSRVAGSPDFLKPWKIQAQLAEASGFAESNVFTVRIPVPVPFPRRLGTSFQASLGGCPFRIGLLSGGDNVSTELLLTNRTDLRLNFLRAEDQTGKNIATGSGNWGQFRFFRLIDMPQPGGEVVETFAIGRNIPVEFVIQPRLLAPAPTRNERN
jgi:RNA polymerase sigma factor (sigma-70 family)